MMDDKQLFYATIAWLRFPLTVLVVLLHTPLLLCDSNIYGNGFACHLKILLSEGVCRAAVPTFFFISGYFFFKKMEFWNWKLWRDKLKSRFYTLLVPYLLWNIVALLFLVPTALSGGGILGFFEERGWIRIFWDSNHYHYTPQINLLGIVMHICKPINFPLWYIRDLMIAVLLSPLIWLYLRKTRLIGLSLLGILMIFNIWIPFEGFSSTMFFFFSFGGYMMIFNRNILQEFKRIEIPAYILSIFILVFMVLTFDTNKVQWSIYHRIFMISGVISVINIGKRIIETNLVKETPFLSASSFWVFCCHALIISKIGRLLYYAGLRGGEVMFIIQYVSTFVLSIIICLISYKIFLLLLPKATKILTGGR